MRHARLHVPLKMLERKLNGKMYLNVVLNLIDKTLKLKKSVALSAVLAFLVAWHRRERERERERDSWQRERESMAAAGASLRLRSLKRFTGAQRPRNVGACLAGKSTASARATAAATGNLSQVLVQGRRDDKKRKTRLAVSSPARSQSSSAREGRDDGEGGVRGKKGGQRRVLLKVSGEALAGQQGFGIDPVVVQKVAREVASAVEEGIQVRTMK